MKTVFVYLQFHSVAFSKEDIEALEKLVSNGKTTVLLEEPVSTSDFFSALKSKTDAEIDSFAMQISEEIFAESHAKDLKVLRDFSQNYNLEIRPIDEEERVLSLLVHISKELAELLLNEQLSGLSDSAENALAAVSLHQMLFSRLGDFRNGRMLKRVRDTIVENSEANLVVIYGTDHFLFLRDALKRDQVEFIIINNERLPAGSELGLQTGALEAIKRLASVEQLEKCISEAVEKLQPIIGSKKTKEAALETSKAAEPLSEGFKLLRHGLLYGPESNLALPKLVKLAVLLSGQSSILRNKNMEGRERAMEIGQLAEGLLALKEPEAGFSLTVASTIILKTELLLLDAEEGKDVRSKDVLNVLSTAFKAAELRESVRKAGSNLKSKV